MRRICEKVVLDGERKRRAECRERRDGGGSGKTGGESVVHDEQWRTENRASRNNKGGGVQGEET